MEIQESENGRKICHFTVLECGPALLLVAKAAGRTVASAGACAHPGIATRATLDGQDFYIVDQLGASI